MREREPGNPLSENKIKKTKFRRARIALSAIAFLGGITNKGSTHYPFENGYHSLTSSEYHALTSDYTETTIPSRQDVSPNPQVLIQATVSLARPEPVFVRMRIVQKESAGKASPTANAQPQTKAETTDPFFTQFRVKAADQTLIVPWVDTPNYPYPAFQIDGLKKGDNTITIFKPQDLPQKYSNVILGFTTPGDTLLGRIVDGTPSLAIRPDDMENPKVNSPLLTCIDFSEKGGKIRAIYYNLFTAEKAGMSPEEVWRKWHRTTDIEPSEIAIWSKDKNSVAPIPVKSYYQGPEHNWGDFKGERNGGTQPELQIATLNNNFGTKIKTDLKYSPISIIPPPGVSCGSYLTGNPDVELLSEEDLLKSGRITEQKLRSLAIINK